MSGLPELPCWMARELHRRLPARVLCGPHFAMLRRRPKAELTCHRYAQASIHDPVIPPFSWAVHNRASGHLHVAWLLAVPLNNRRRRQREMLADVQGRLCQRLGADPRHHGRGAIPNPLYRGGEAHTEWGSAQPMRLGEFYEWLEETVRIMRVDEAMRGMGQAVRTGPPGRPLTGDEESRHCALFHAVRFDAYAAARAAGSRGWDERRFAEHVLGLTRRANVADLPTASVEFTARSIARFAWEHRGRSFARLPFPEHQSALGRRSGKLRRARTWERDQRIVALHEEGLSQRRIAQVTGLSKNAVRHVLTRTMTPGTGSPPGGRRTGNR